MALQKISRSLLNTGVADSSDATAITIDSSENVTFAGTLASTGVLTANAGVVVDNITIDGTEIDLSSGDLTLDVAGDITLDADGGDIKFLDDGTVIGKFSNQGSGNFNIISSVQDKDLIFKGNDGGSTITALTLDMSDAGKATFNSGANFGTTSSSTYAVQIQATTGGNALQLKGRNAAENAGWLVWTDYAGNAEAGMYATADTLIFANTTSYTERMRISSTGSVGIGIAPETTYSGHVALEIGQQGTLIANRSGDDLSIKINTYLDGSGNWKRKETGVASALDFDGDQWKFFTAASGSADANISFAQKLRIDNDGIKFGSDTAAANALDDYEEGTFDPSFTLGSGSITPYTSYNTLGYTKVGRVVTITGMIALESVSSPSGSLTIGNLPFALNSPANRAGLTRPTIHVYCSGSGAPAVNKYYVGFIAFGQNSTSGTLIITHGSGDQDTTPGNWFAAGSDLFLNFTYIAAT